MSIYRTPVRLPHGRSMSEMDLLSTLHLPPSKDIFPGTLPLAAREQHQNPATFYQQHDDYQEDLLHRQPHSLMQDFQQQDELQETDSFQQIDNPYLARTPSPAWKKLRSMSLRRKPTITPTLTTSMISAPVPGSFRGSPYKVDKTSGRVLSGLMTSPSYGLLPSPSWIGISTASSPPPVLPSPALSNPALPSAFLPSQPAKHSSEEGDYFFERATPETPTPASQTPRILVSESGASPTSQHLNSPTRPVANINNPRLFPSPSRSSTLQASPGTRSVDWNSGASTYSHTSTSPLLRSTQSNVRLQPWKSLRRSRVQHSQELAPLHAHSAPNRALNARNPGPRSSQEPENNGSANSLHGFNVVDSAESTGYQYSPLRSTSPSKERRPVELYRNIQPPHQPALFTRTASRIKRTIKKAASFASFGAIESPERKVQIPSNRFPQHKPEELHNYEHCPRDIPNAERTELDSTPAEETAISLSQIRSAGAHTWYEDGRKATNESVIYEESSVRMMRAQDRAHKVEVVDVQHQPIEAVHVGDSGHDDNGTNDGERQLYVSEIRRYHSESVRLDNEEESLLQPEEEERENITPLPQTPSFLLEHALEYPHLSPDYKHDTLEGSVDMETPFEDLSEVFMAPQKTGQGRSSPCPLPLPIMQSGDAVLLGVSHAPFGKSPRKSNSSNHSSPVRDTMMRASVMTTSTNRSQLSAQWFRSPSERLGLRVRLTRLGGRAPWNQNGSGINGANSQPGKSSIGVADGQVMKDEQSPTVTRRSPAPKMMGSSPSPRRDVEIESHMLNGSVNGSPVAKRNGWFGRRFGKVN